MTSSSTLLAPLLPYSKLYSPFRPPTPRVEEVEFLNVRQTHNGNTCRTVLVVAVHSMLENGRQSQ